MPNLPQFSVENAIVHEIYKRPSRTVRKDDPNQEQQPTLTDLPIAMKPELVRFLERRIVRTMGQAFQVRFTRPPTTSVNKYVVDLLAEPGKGLVVASHALTLALHAAQDTINPGGLVVVAHGTLAPKRRWVTVMKLEHESGVRADVVTTATGKKQFEITIENELFLTDKTKVFKLGVFMSPDNYVKGAATRRPALDPTGVECWVADDQVVGGGSPIARFWREDYLGCEFIAAAQITTQDFQLVAEKWINQNTDGEMTAKYVTALVAELGSTKPSITPRDFARDNLEVSDRQPFLDALRDAGVPRTRFVKDTTLVSNRIRRTLVKTETGVEIYAGEEHFKSKVVQVKARKDGKDLIEVNDTIAQVHGR